jgi:hypothetical protein
MSALRLNTPDEQLRDNSLPWRDSEMPKESSSISAGMTEAPLWGYRRPHWWRPDRSAVSQEMDAATDLFTAEVPSFLEALGPAV